jgi:hypothetical protein
MIVKDIYEHSGTERLELGGKQFEQAGRVT